MPSKIRFNPLRAMRNILGTKPLRWLTLCACKKALCVYNPTGDSRSCASCGHKKQGRAITKHGLCRTREYHRFNQAKARCTCPTNARWAGYGGRGIEWRFESYEQAYAELGPCPKGLTLDRMDNNGHYEPGNVRWASWREQFASRRPWNWRIADQVKTTTGKVIEMYNSGLSAGAIGKVFSRDPETIRQRLIKAGVVMRARRVQIAA
jgi:hypothetical protein